jgi:hypothetical protein
MKRAIFYHMFKASLVFQKSSNISTHTHPCHIISPSRTTPTHYRSNASSLRILLSTPTSHYHP